MRHVARFVFLALAAGSVLALGHESWSSPPADCTFMVNSDGTGDFPTIQAAIDAATEGDVICLVDGVYRGEGNRDLDYRGKAVVVRSVMGDPEECIIDCEGDPDQHRGFRFHTGEGAGSILQGIEIRDGMIASLEGWPVSGGAGILCEDGASPTIRDCVFRENMVGWASTGGFGGGFSCGGGSPALVDCRFIHNGAAARGGGLYACDGAAPLLIGCVFTDNFCSAWHGGAIAMQENCAGQVRDCSFTNNRAYSSSGRGGAIYLWGSSSPCISSCSFDENRPSAIAGWVGCSPLIYGCTFRSNTTPGNGGAAWFMYDAYPRFRYCSFEFNSSDYPGGAVDLEGSSHAVFELCAFCDNDCPLGGTALSLQGGSSASVKNCTMTAASGGVVGLWAGVSPPSPCHAILENTLIITSMGGPVIAPVSGASTVVASCCDFHSSGGGCWTGYMADQLGTNGNIDLDPLFCLTPVCGEPMCLVELSPCAPYSPPNADCGLIGRWPVHCPVSMVDQAPTARPKSRGVLDLEVRGAPSSFITLLFGLAKADAVRLSVHDITGRQVRLLIPDAVLSAGNHRVSWSGTDDIGGAVPGGVYFCRLQAQGQWDSRGLVLLR